MCVRVIFSLIVWFVICAFISLILLGGSSEEAMTLKWLLFCGVPIGLIAFNLKAHNGKYNKKQEGGDFTMKQTPSAIKSKDAKVDIITKPSVVEYAISAN